MQPVTTMPAVAGRFCCKHGSTAQAPHQPSQHTHMCKLLFHVAVAAPRPAPAAAGGRRPGAEGPGSGRGVHPPQPSRRAACQGLVQGARRIAAGTVRLCCCWGIAVVGRRPAGRLRPATCRTAASPLHGALPAACWANMRQSKCTRGVIWPPRPQLVDPRKQAPTRPRPRPLLYVHGPFPPHWCRSGLRLPASPAWARAARLRAWPAAQARSARLTHRPTCHWRWTSSNAATQPLSQGALGHHATRRSPNPSCLGQAVVVRCCVRLREPGIAVYALTTIRGLDQAPSRQNQLHRH